jgi:uncharacterized protein
LVLNGWEKLGDVPRRVRRRKEKLTMKEKTIQWVHVVFLIGCLVLGGLLAPSWGAEGGLLDAAGAGDLARVKSLIAAKADVNAKDEYGLTALILASMRGRVDVVRALLAAKADVNTKSNTGGTALMAASMGGHVKVMKLLRQAGATE